MIIRSLHAGRPFIAGHNCLDHGIYQLCVGRELLVINELDEGEVWDISLYRTMVMFLDYNTDSILTKMLAATLTDRMERFSVPNAHAMIGNELPTGPLPVPERGLGFVYKPGAIVEIPQYTYLKILRELKCTDDPPDMCEYDYVAELRNAPLVVPVLYRVETLAHVLYTHLDAILDMLGVSKTERDYIAEEIRSEMEIDPTIDIVAEAVAEALGYTLEQKYRVRDKIVETVYKLVEDGNYEPPEIVGISVYKNGEYVAEGCEAARIVFDLLPERDREIVRKYCSL